MNDNINRYVELNERGVVKRIVDLQSDLQSHGLQKKRVE